MSLGLFAFKRAVHADMTSNFAVRRAVFGQHATLYHWTYIHLTSIDQCDGIIDGFLGVGLEDLCHVWKGWKPLQGVS